jgi:hypothetical protein
MDIAISFMDAVTCCADAAISCAMSVTERIEALDSSIATAV